VAEDLYLDTDEVRSIQEAMEALHITCVNDETAKGLRSRGVPLSVIFMRGREWINFLILLYCTPLFFRIRDLRIILFEKSLKHF